MRENASHFFFTYGLRLITDNLFRCLPLLPQSPLLKNCSLNLAAVKLSKVIDAIAQLLGKNF